jgi:hypothetical protein
MTGLEAIGIGSDEVGRTSVFFISGVPFEKLGFAYFESPRMRRTASSIIFRRGYRKSTPARNTLPELPCSGLLLWLPSLLLSSFSRSWQTRLRQEELLHHRLPQITSQLRQQSRNRIASILHQRRRRTANIPIQPCHVVLHLRRDHRAPIGDTRSMLAPFPLIVTSFCPWRTQRSAPTHQCVRPSPANSW